jgi:hypothetical protein
MIDKAHYLQLCELATGYTETTGIPVDLERWCRWLDLSSAEISARIGNLRRNAQRRGPPL